MKPIRNEFLFLGVVLFISIAASALRAAGPLNLQTCPGPLASGGLMGCPNAAYAPVAPGTLVRSFVGGTQGWRTFSTLKPVDQVYAQDGAWHALNTIVPATVSPPVPPTPPTPPVVTNVTYTVTQTSGSNTVSANFVLPGTVQQCFTLSAGTHSTAVCLPANP